MGYLVERFLKEEAGQDLVEYALLILMVLAIALSTIKSVGQKMTSIFSMVVTSL